MKILRNREELARYIFTLKRDGVSLGFVPTMGALHDGHLSLFRVAKEENDLVIFSIFVNPTQFNNAEDLKKYPRTEEKDLRLLQDQNVDAVYLPQTKDIYPEKMHSQHFDFNGIEKEMEGKMRPGHFDGVATVVLELLKQVQPDRAYFGEKDFQQLLIIKKLQKQMNLPVEIRGVAIRREENGLAMSSRNARLSDDAKEGATVIYKTLQKVREWFRVISISEIKRRVAEIFVNSPYELEYFVIADEDTLQETDFFYKDKNYRAFIVVHVEGVRLIDNLHLD